MKKFSLGAAVLPALLPVNAYAEKVSLGIYPPIIRVKANPEADITVPLTVINYSPNPLSVDIKLQGIEDSGKENGTLKLLTQDATPKLTSSIFKGIKILDQENEVKNINLYPSEIKNLNLTFRAPKDRGDYYFSVIFQTQNKEEKTDSTLVHQSIGVASNILVSTSNSESYGTITEFSGKSLLFEGPNSFKLTVLNNSNSYESVSGNMVIYDAFGNRLVNEQIKPFIILKGASRNVNIEAGNKFMFGYYTAKANISFDKGKTISSETHFIGIPVLILLIGTLILFVILSIAFKAIKKVNFES